MHEMSSQRRQEPASSACDRRFIRVTVALAPASFRSTVKIWRIQERAIERKAVPPTLLISCFWVCVLVRSQLGQRLFVDAGYDMHKRIDNLRDVVLNRCAQHQGDFVRRQLVIGR
jgi:hypothetical protein